MAFDSQNATNKADRPPLWTRDFTFVALCRMFNSSVFNLYIATLVTYCMTTYGLDAGAAGLNLTLFLVGAIVSRIVSGKYLDVVGRRKMLIVSLVMFVIPAALYFLPMPYWVFLVVRAIHGFAFGLNGNCLTIAAIDCIPSERFGEGMGYFAVGACLAAAVGPFTGTILLHNFGFGAVFGIGLAYAVATLVMGMCLRLKPHEEEHERALRDLSESRGFRLDDFVEKSAVPISAVVFCTNCCYSSITSFVENYSTVLGFAQFSEIFFIEVCITMVVTRPSSGKLYDAHGLGVVMIPSLLLLGVSLGLFAGAAVVPALILVAAVLASAGYGTTSTTGQTVVLQAVPSHRVGVATSTYMIFADIGMGCGPMLFGSAANAVGYSGMYAIGCGVMTIVLVCFVVGYSRKKARKQGID